MNKGFKRFLMAGGIVLASVATIGALQPVKANEYFNEKYYSTAIPDNYYTSVDTTLTGDAFRDSLYYDISRNYNQHSYSYNSTVLKYTDPDPNHPGKVIGFYSGDSISSGAWNKEHVWAKSHGFGDTKGAEPYCDAHHLRPTYNNINTRRSNYDFGEITSGGNPDRYGNKQADGVFEPRNEVKGDVARIMFYMATRYGAKTRYNLKLVTDRTTGLSNGNGRFGGLNTLLKWHYNDPVSKEEIYRNNVIYEDFQHNRNPYIDHPEWVALAYPNNYDDGSDIPTPNPNPSDNDATKVIELINKLPSTVTLDDKDTLLAAKKAYDALASSAKNSVTNKSKLEAATKAMDNLEHPKFAPEEAGDTISISKALEIAGNNGDSGSSTRYIIKGNLTEIKHELWGNITITDGINSIYAHSCYAANGIDKFGTITPKPQIGDTLTLSVNLGTFKGKKEALDARVIGVNLPDTPKPEENTNPTVAAFINEDTNSSISVALNAGVIDADLRIFGRIKADSFKDTAKYGILVVEDNRDLTTGIQSVNSISGLTKTRSLEIKPVRVNANGAADENGEYYQFGWVITNMENHYEFGFNTALYMELDGKLYLAKPHKTSLKATTNFMISNSLVNDPIIKKALEDLFK